MDMLTNSTVPIISKVLWVVLVSVLIAGEPGVLPCHILRETLSRAVSDTPGRSWAVGESDPVKKP